MFRLKIFFLLFFITCSIAAQELYFKPSLAFQNILSNETYKTFQDSKGVIWACTDGGINRYDGNSTTNFTKKDGLVENTVFKAYEDRKGRIWFSSVSGMLCYYEKDSFHSIAANPELKILGRSFSHHSFFIGEKDTLYFCTNGFSGILKIPPQNNYKTVIPLNTKEMQQSFYGLFTNPLKPNEGILTNSGCYNYQIDHFTQPLWWDNKTYNINRKSPYRGYNNLWRAALNVQGNTFYAPCGLDLAVIKKNETVTQNYYFKQEIIAIYPDHEGDLWVLCYRGGGYLYKKGDLTSKPIHFLNNLSVSSIMIDREGTIWATTLEKGVFICNSKNVLAIPNNENDQINTLQVDTNRLLVPYFSKQLIFFFKHDSILKDTAKCVFAPEHFLRGYYQKKDYFYYNVPGANFYVSVKKNTVSAKLSLSTALEIKEYIPYKGDTVLGPSFTNLAVFYHKKKIASLKTPFILSCAKNLQDGTVLIGSRDNKGIFEFKNNQFIPYYPHLEQLKIRINAMAEDKRKRLWLATENGLMCLDEKKVLHEYKKKTDPLSLKINSLAVDENGNIWCSNGNSLICMQANSDLENPSIRIFNSNHGIPDTRIDRLAAFDNRIFCATKDYLFYFKNDALKKNTQPPLTQLKSIYINGIEHSFSDTLTISHDQNNIVVEATSSTYKSNDSIIFFYKLEGYNDKWQRSNKGNIQYTNLDHGSYKLLVCSVNNDGVKGGPTSLKLIIERPFWYTWWFILVEIVAIVITFYYFLTIWRKRIEKTEQEKTKVNQKIAEFKMTALRSQMNPHFIFNAIGSIQHFILQNEAKQSYNYLAKFSMLIRNILNNSREEYISLEQEITTLRLYIELEQIRFETPFHFIIDIDKTLDMEMDIPTMLIQPYVENSIWHGLMPKTSGGVLELLFKKVNGNLHIIIKDDGVGRKKKDSSQKHISRGMSITEQRIETLEATSQKKFKTFIVDLKDENGNATGTEVNIIIPIDEK